MAAAIAPARPDRYTRALVDRARDAELLEHEMRARARDAADQRDVSDLFDSEHPTVDDTDTSVVVALARSAEQRRRDVDAALARLADGRYGRCERCDARIPAARLLALPETRHCLDCKVGLERAASRR
jgi:RNA polymerase-binding transcription factor DksA